MRYLLDANIISDMMRNPYGHAAVRLREAGHLSVCTSIIVSAELLFGARKRGSLELFRRIENALSMVQVLSFEPPADLYYAQIRASLEAKGTPISGNDLLIGAQALAMDLVVVTDNVREFSRIEGLEVENWLQDDASG